MSGVLIQIAVFFILWRLAGVPWAFAATLGVLSLRLALRIVTLQSENQELRGQLREHETASDAEAGHFRSWDASSDIEPESGFRPLDATRDEAIEGSGGAR